MFIGVAGGLSTYCGWKYHLRVTVRVPDHSLGAHMNIGYAPPAAFWFV